MAGVRQTCECVRGCSRHLPTTIIPASDGHALCVSLARSSLYEYRTRDPFGFMFLESPWGYAISRALSFVDERKLTWRLILWVFD